mgnify:CR=1 FL=1
MIKYKLNHIGYVVSSLEKSADNFESAFGFPCEFINPFRNLVLPQNSSAITSDFHPSLFTVAVGNALSSANKVNVLPTFYKENEQFRMINKVFFPAAAVFIAFLLSFSGFKYTGYLQIQNQIPQLHSSNNDICMECRHDFYTLTRIWTRHKYFFNYYRCYVSNHFTDF